MNWYELGKEHIFRPYSRQVNPVEALKIARAEGSYLYTIDDRRIIDGIASWWTVAHGHNHPQIVEAIKNQADKLCHVMFADIAHENAYLLAKELIEFLPYGFEKVFYSESGSAAIDVALKMSLQYWRNCGYPRKTKFLFLENGYHGESFGAMSVSDPHLTMSHHFQAFIPENIMISLPTNDEEFATLNMFIKQHENEIAAIIVEPLMQGAAGMNFYSTQILKNLHNLIKYYDILFIADEIATNFYRIGSKFAITQASIVPDIICLGKALSGGAISLAATVITDRIYQAFYSDKMSEIFYHSSTFNANPLATSAARASLYLFKTIDYSLYVANLEQHLLKSEDLFRNLPIVKSVQTKGAVFRIELKNISENLLYILRQSFLDQGCLVRPIANVVYLAPPLNIDHSDLDFLLHVVLQNLKVL